MAVFFIILFIIFLILMILKDFYKKEGKIKQYNLMQGGLSKIFSDWVRIAELNNFKLIKDDGLELTFSKKFESEWSRVDFYIVVKRNFTNIVYSWSISSANKKTNGLMIEFRNNLSDHEIQNIFNRFHNYLEQKGALSTCYLKEHNWKFKLPSTQSRYCDGCKIEEDYDPHRDIWVRVGIYK